MSDKAIENWENIQDRNKKKRAIEKMANERGSGRRVTSISEELSRDEWFIKSMDRSLVHADPVTPKPNLYEDPGIAAQPVFTPTSVTTSDPFVAGGDDFPY